MKKIINIMLGIGQILFTSLAFAGSEEVKSTNNSLTEIDEVIVSAALIPIPVDRSASSITIIDSELLKLQASSSISDLLRNVPGFAVSQSGGLGALSEIRARGAESNHLVVLVDGIEVNDPSQADMTNWGTFSSNEIERIEIIRGPQSALTGSDAIAGIVNVVTSSSKDPVSAEIFSERGTNSFLSHGLNFGGFSEKLNYKFGATRSETEGYNIRPDAGSLDDDGFNNKSFNFNSSYKINERFTTSLSSRKSYGMAEYDDEGSDDMSSEFDRQFTKIQGDYISGSGLWAHSLKLSQSKFENFEFNGIAPNGGAQSAKNNYQYLISTFVDEKNQQISWVVEKETQKFKQFPSSGIDNNLTLDRNVDSAAFEYRFDPLDSITLATSARHEDNDSFENSTTGRLEVIYRPLDNLKWRAVMGTAVKNPTYTELYGSFERFQANEFLIPEKSSSWEIGFDVVFPENQLQLSATYFNSKLKDEISKDWDNCDVITWVCPLFNNPAISERQGVEVSSSFVVNKQMKGNFSYTYTDSEDGNGQNEGRRPKDIASLNFIWKPLTDSSINLNIKYNGEQFGWAPTDPYTLVDLNAVVGVNDFADFYVNLTNIFDEEYQDVRGYDMPGFGIRTGIRYKLW